MHVTRKRNFNNPSVIKRKRGLSAGGTLTNFP